MGFDINNGIKPASKNISQDGIIEEDTHERFYKWQVWGWTRFCNRKRGCVGVCEKAKVTGVIDKILNELGMVDIFLSISLGNGWKMFVFLKRSQKRR